MTQDMTRKMTIIKKTLLMVLMVTFGINVSWGQPVGNNFSGTYYIANYDANNYSATSNTNNYYLCPSEVFYDYDGTPANQKPYLTTHKPDPIGRPTEPIAKWKIVYASTSNTGDDKGVDYYYIKYVAPNGNEMYMVHNGQIASNQDRVRLHLQSDKDATDENNNLFSFTAGTKGDKKNLNICPKASANGNRSLNPAKANTDSYSGVKTSSDPGSFNQGSTKIWCGGLIGYYDSNDDRGLWYLEDIVENPVVSINSDGKAVISSSNTSATYYYTTDGTTIPTTGSAQYTAPIDITGVETIKAIAVVNGESSNVATFTVGNGTPYLIQNQECTAYYLVPGDPSATNVTATTSSIAGPKMEWLRKFAGNVNGIQYYYFVNNSTKDYLYYSGEYVYVKSSSDIIPSDGSYKFNIFARNADESYNIFPNGVANGLYKRSYNASPEGIRISTELVKDFYHWKFIPTSGVTDKKPLFDAPKDNTGAALTLSSITDGATYYFISNVGTSGSYIVYSSGVTYASTSITETDKAKSWMLVKADEEDNWQTYYHIVSAATGKYMHFKGTDATTTTTIDNAIEMEEQPSGIADQFVLARATNANTYYIIPRLHYETFKDNKYYSLNNNNSQVKTTLSRASSENNVKWTFEKNTTPFCLDPVAKLDGDGNVSLECPTIGAEIHYTDNGDTPNSSSSAFDPSTPWTATDTKVIKAIAVLKNDDDVQSDNTITVYNNPDITLDPGYTNYTYDRSAHEPGINSVFIGETNIESTWYSTVTSSNYSNNINAGTAKVTLEDVPDDNIFVYNASKEFTINPVTLTVIANANQTKGYGDPDPVLTYTYDTGAIVSGDVVEEIQTGELERAPGEAVGTYAINVGTLTFTNYSISFTGNDFEITKKSLGSGNTPAENITCDITETNGTHSIVVKQGGNDLTLGTDYTKSSETEDTKYYNVTVAGIGNYKDGFTVKLAKIQLSKLTGSSEPGGAALFVSNSSDGDFEVPSDMTAYIVTGISGNNLVLEELDNIPENKPVLLLSTIDANGFLVQPKASATPPTGTNMLEEVTDNPSKHFDTAEIYLLYKGEFVLNMEGYLAKGKIYLPKPSDGSPAPTHLGIVWEQGTSIDATQLSVLNAQLPDTWYTLDGQRLNSPPTKKGLYLWMGKKVVVK